MSKPLNYMYQGMWPLNYCSRLVKEANDVMFSLAVDDRSSAEARLNALENTVAALRKSIEETSR